MKSHIDMLLKNGGDISINDNEGKSIVSIAKGKDIQNMLEGSLVSWLSRTTQAPKGNKTFGDSLSFGTLKLDSTGKNKEAKSADDMIDEFISSSAVDDRSRVVLSMQVQLQMLQDHRWSYSRSPLSWAVNNGLVDAVREMLLNGADPNTKDAVGRTPLHECLSLAGHSKTESFAHAALSIAERLMEAGALLNVTSISGRSPLHEIFCKDQDNSKSSYIRDGTGNSSYKPSKIKDKDAIAQYRRLLVRNMLQWGADPYLRDRHGLAAIHYCARENMSGCLVEILRAGYDAGYPTAQGQSCLHFACKAGALKVIHLICRWDADYRVNRSIITRKDKKGTFPIQLLPSKAFSKCFDTLWVCVRLGDIVKTVEILNDLKKSKQALWSELESTEDDVDAMEMLRSSLNASNKGFRSGEQELWLLDGIDTKSRRSSWTALHACIVGQAEFESTKTCEGRPKINTSARKALELPPLAPQSNNSKVTLLGPPSKHENILKQLLQNGAFVDSCDVNCRTPLMYAAAADLPNVCKILIESGADLQSKDLDGNTALHFAYMYGSKHSVVVLESLGADDNVDNNFGREPLSEAGREKHFKPIFFNNTKKDKLSSSLLDKGMDNTLSSSGSFKNTNLKIDTYQEDEKDNTAD
jgi:ankyrin repeat protein